MAIACAVTVANLFYSQPLLADIGRSFGVAEHAGYVSTCTLIGVMCGILAFVPWAT